MSRASQVALQDHFTRLLHLSEDVQPPSMQPVRNLLSETFESTHSKSQGSFQVC